MPKTTAVHCLVIGQEIKICEILEQQKPYEVTEQRVFFAEGIRNTEN